MQVANLAGAVHRCACDTDWTMDWLSEMETSSGYPASDFIASSVRSFASIIHPDDREQVERSVMAAADANRASRSSTESNGVVKAVTTWDSQHGPQLPGGMRRARAGRS